MADLSNSKIKDTYQGLLQVDGSGNVQTALGAFPNPIIIRGNLAYVDGNQQSGYVLKSDGDGNASWGDVSAGDLYISAATLDNTILKLQTTSGSTISVPVSYWSSDGLGNYANSGLTGNIGIGTTTPHEKLTVVGTISGSSIGAMLALSAGTDLYLGNETFSASTIYGEEQITIKGREPDNDFLVLKKDRIQMWLDGAIFSEFLSKDDASTSAGATFNASSEDYDFTIKGDDATPIFQLYGESGGNRIRIRDHLTIGRNEAVSHAQMVDWGLAVTGSSLFYSGGTKGVDKNAIAAYGNMAITGDINIFNNYSLRTANISTTGGTPSERLTIEAGATHIRNEDGLTEYLRLNSNGFTFFVNDTEAVIFNIDSGKYIFDTRPGSATDWYTFEIAGDKGYNILEVEPEWEILRMKEHVAIGAQHASWPNAKAITYGLHVSGSSIFYSGGSAAGTNVNAIEVEGNISLWGNMVATGDVISSGLTATIGAITSGTTNLNDLFVKTSDLNYTSDDFWSGETGNTLFPISPTNTKLGIGTNTPVQTLEVAGSISASTTLNVGIDINVGNDIKFKDNGQALFGAASDLSIIHNSIKSIITNTTGELLFQNDADNADIRFKGTDDTSTITALTLDMSDAGTAIFNHDISLSDNGQILLGDGSDLKIYHSGSHSIIQDAGTGNLELKGSIVKIRGTAGGDDALIYTENAGVELYYDNTKSFETTTDGVTISGNLTAKGLVSNGNAHITGTTYSNGFSVIGGGVFTGNLTGNADTVTNGVYTTNNLSVMASTTSAQLRGVLSDETGTGSAVFATSPTLVTPALGTPSSGTLTNATGYPGDSDLVAAGIVTSGTWASDRKFLVPVTTPGEGMGDIVYLGETVTTAGAIYYYSASGDWVLTDANATSTSTGLLGVALGDSSAESGMLLRGMVALNTDPGNISLPIYLSETAGKATTTAPTTSGAVVRVLGYSVATTDTQIWFNPDNTWVELS